ncbi:MAG: phosphoenolpyruvate carboxykinase (ATP), partial [Bacteroidota bacterium]
ETRTDPNFGFEIPLSCPGVPSEILVPRDTWQDKDAFDATKEKLVGLFQNNFKAFEDSVNPEIIEAGPKAQKLA